MRGLQQIATREGIFVICAMDHRGSLQGMIDPVHPEAVGYQQMVQRKLELCAALAPHASAVLLDPLFGAAQCIDAGVLPGPVGLLVSLEASGYSGDAGSRLTELLEGWGAEKIRRLGGSAAKLLVYYRPDLKEVAAKQRDIVTRAARDCLAADLLFLVEPKTYRLEGEGTAELAARLPDLVIDTAREIATLPIDVLKAEFPADMRYEQDEGRLLDLCRKLDEASPVPWVLLSGGAGFDVFCRQVEIACRAGASGFLGGRAIWQEAMAIQDAGERVRYLETTVVDRLKKLIEIATRHAVPWQRKLAPQQARDLSEEWYQGY
jgi:tagatose 1,6-diphosphate aldolase